MSEFLDSLPEEVRQGDHWQGIETAEDLAKAFQSSKTASFADTLPEDLKGHEALKDMDAGKLAKSYVDTIGKAPQLPKSVDDYQDIEVPEGMPFDEADHKLFREAAFEAGLTNDQLQKVVKWQMDRVGALYERLEAQQKETVAALAKEENLSEDDIVKKVDETAEKMGLGEMLKRRADLRGDPDVMKFILTASKRVGEDSLRFGNQGASGSLRTAIDGSKIPEYPSMNT